MMFALHTHAASTHKDIERITDSDRALVYYFGFEIQRIAGIPEQQIEEYGCRYVTSKSKFLKLLSISHSQNDLHYEKLDIRAKVIFLAGASYYIDRDGIVRSGDQYFVIDKKRSLIF